MPSRPSFLPSSRDSLAVHLVFELFTRTNLAKLALLENELNSSPYKHRAFQSTCQKMWTCYLQGWQPPWHPLENRWRQSRPSNWTWRWRFQNTVRGILDLNSWIHNKKEINVQIPISLLKVCFSLFPPRNKSFAETYSFAGNMSLLSRAKFFNTWRSWSKMNSCTDVI